MSDHIPSKDGVEWRCFHCDEVFTDREAAADHFGVQIDGCADDVACKLNATDGMLVRMLREAQEELRRYHQEDDAAFRQFYALGAEHSTALRREEEKGYARGLQDARLPAETAAVGSQICRKCGSSDMMPWPSTDDPLPKPQTEFCWLIENGDSGDALRYRYMDQMGIHWTPDPHKAIRFARRADAEMFAEGDEDAWRIVEHGFEPPAENGGAAP